MIYPPAYDPMKLYQELEHNGRRIAILTGTLAEVAQMLDTPLSRALAACPCLPESEWLEQTPAAAMTDTD